MPKKLNLTGKRFGRLVVLSEAEKNNGRVRYKCLCDCGTEVITESSYLVQGKKKSCGCLRKEVTIARSKARYSETSKRNTKLYHRYHSMYQRCTNPNNPSWHNYGGRGITMCDRWLSSYDNFLADMGEPPTEKHTLERIDNNLGYSPENCMWADRKTQLRNQRRSIIITWNGITRHAKDWCEMYSIPYQRLTKEYRRGGIDGATKFVSQHLERQITEML